MEPDRYFFEADIKVRDFYGWLGYNVIWVPIGNAGYGEVRVYTPEDDDDDDDYGGGDDGGDDSGDDDGGDEDEPTYEEILAERTDEFNESAGIVSVSHDSMAAKTFTVNDSRLIIPASPIVNIPLKVGDTYLETEITSKGKITVDAERLAYAIGFSVQHKDNGNYVVWHSNGKGFEYTAPNHGVANLLTQWGINGTLITRRTDMWGNTYPIYGDDFDKNTNKVSCHTGGQPIDYNRYWALNEAGGYLLEFELSFFMGGIKAPNKGLDKVIPTWKGSGPAQGVLGVNYASKSIAAIKNYYPKEGAIEFIFDPATNTFLVGKGKHAALAKLINADTSKVVGGIFKRGPNGQILTNEASGHFYQNWNLAVRKQFQEVMKEYGLPVTHSVGQ